MTGDIFNEDSLRADIVKVWGEHGAHVDLFDFMVKAIRSSGDEIERLRGDSMSDDIVTVEDLIARLGHRDAMTFLVAENIRHREEIERLRELIRNYIRDEVM